MASHVLLKPTKHHVLRQAAKMANSASDMPVTFDLIDEIIVDRELTLLETLTQEEQDEVSNVVTLLDAAKDNSLDQFEPNENSPFAARHKHLSDEELDHLTGKNSAQSTSYQTKWAVVVIKDKCHPLITVILHKT